VNVTSPITQPRTRTRTFDRVVTGAFTAHLFILYAAGCARAVYAAAQHLA
jgi:hypothetical protein